MQPLWWRVQKVLSWKHLDSWPCERTNDRRKNDAARSRWKRAGLMYKEGFCWRPTTGLAGILTRRNWQNELDSKYIVRFPDIFSAGFLCSTCSYRLCIHVWPMDVGWSGFVVVVVVVNVSSIPSSLVVQWKLHGKCSVSYGSPLAVGIRVYL